ncbi:cysteine-rich secretory protein family protein [Hirsutella rhossiliensis]|uniref:Cysteine-rich secretory protein family domain-containing protein n=1 Tax=Hirsutella rhossiliensis TaxID=111463 RepID=A0A9P8MZ06_9HYPO|nr:cysteine-rich secretory protein family domain-containing protein [Hirsutella rhossiliensis]KAH0963855.1 cysteine-rich secretory protein family domain-containing protein [Hirsutella rhossiliensis]
MKSSMFLVATSALLASASPIRDAEKRAPVKTVTEWVYATEISTAVVTLAPGQEPPAEDAKFNEVKKPLRFNDVEDSPEAAPTNIFDLPPPDVVVDPPRQPRPAHVPSEYEPNNRPRPTAAPRPARPDRKEPEPTYAPRKPKESEPSAGGNLDEYAKSMLDKHNEARREHRVPAFKWNDELAQAAKSSAENCIDNHDNHGKGFGQNLAWLWTSDQGDSATKVALGGVKSWYDEKKNFGNLYGVPDPTSGNFNAIGHYTQMVWKATDEVGCATHRCSNSKVDWVTVCNYKKPGNVPGQFGEMVPQPS